MSKNERGFSLLEALMVVAIILIGASVAIVQLRSSMAILDADKAANLVTGQLRFARQVAVDQRRNVWVEFAGDSQIRITRLDPDSVKTVLADVTLPTGFKFSKPDSVEATPDEYPVFFNLNTSGTFQADGTFIGDDGLVVNGTIFTMGSDPSSARAATLTGSTGRTRIFGLQGDTWKERK